MSPWCWCCFLPFLPLLILRVWLLSLRRRLLLPTLFWPLWNAPKSVELISKSFKEKKNWIIMAAIDKSGQKFDDYQTYIIVLLLVGFMGTYSNKCATLVQTDAILTRPPLSRSYQTRFSRFQFHHPTHTHTHPHTPHTHHTLHTKYFSLSRSYRSNGFGAPWKSQTQATPDLFFFFVLLREVRVLLSLLFHILLSFVYFSVTISSTFSSLVENENIPYTFLVPEWCACGSLWTIMSSSCHINWIL